MGSKVSIINYGFGNIWSVQSALKYLNYESEIISDPNKIRKSNVLILPGVGSFRKAIESIRNSQIDIAVKEALNNNCKILGICLGMQLLANSSTEDGDNHGLGLIDVEVERFNYKTDSGFKVPHIGFNKVLSQKESILFKNIDREAYFYFVHSYRLINHSLNGISAICNYGEDFLAAYEFNNIFATQFHPEKSQTNGLILLNNFLEYK